VSLSLSDTPNVGDTFGDRIGPEVSVS
jgi:hypothetical protein